MISFKSDYTAGAHPKVLEALVEHNFEHTAGYGADPYTAEAVELIRRAVGQPNAEVYLLVGGTQTNATVIDALLRRHEGVLAADTGHINVHEAGAVEASGHKVLALPHCDGKVMAEEVEHYISTFYADQTHPHMVAPGMLYISQPTELGSIFSLSELEALSEVCRRHEIPLYIDGARLGYALGAQGADFTLRDIARLADIFYIGGTKVGTLFGEAVVARPGLLHNFFSLIKQHGALLAKGRLLGLQFGVLFRDGLYEQIGRKAVELALRMREIFRRAGCEVAVESPTNQQFFRLDNRLIDKLSERVSFEYWGPRGEQHSTIRLVTGWATTEAEIEELERATQCAVAREMRNEK